MLQYTSIRIFLNTPCGSASILTSNLEEADPETPMMGSIDPFMPQFNNANKGSHKKCYEQLAADFSFKTRQCGPRMLSNSF